MYDYVVETRKALGSFAIFSFITSLLAQLFLQGESRA